MFCAFHKERLAHEKCELCGKPVCADCHRVVSGKSFCIKCFPSLKNIEKKYQPRNPLMAALFGIFPGLGQVYNGQLMKAFFIFFTSWLIIPWFYGMYDAYATACQINDREVDINPSPALLAGCLLSIILIFGMFSGGPFFMLRALPHFVDRISGQAGHTQVKKVFEEMTDALESYHSDYQRFPKDEKELHFAEIPYLNNMYCGTARWNYYFKCEFSVDHYLITATPLKKGLARYRIQPGSAMERF